MSLSAFGVDHGYEVSKAVSVFATGAKTAKRSAAMRGYSGSFPKPRQKPSVVGGVRQGRQNKLNALVAPYKGGTQKSRSSLPLQARIVRARLDKK